MKSFHRTLSPKNLKKMKLLATLISSTLASHFRAASYQYRQDGGSISVTRTMGWRRTSDGYGAGCTQANIDNQDIRLES